MSREKFEQFNRELIRYAQKNNIRILESSGNTLAIARSSRKILLYVKESSLDNGFWGLMEGKLSNFNERARQERNLSWYVVLLGGHPTLGFILPSGVVQQMIDDNRFGYSKTQRQYKVYEYRIPKEYEFWNFQEFPIRVLETD